MHFVKIFEVVKIGENAAGSGVVLEIVEHAVDLVEQAFFVLVLYAELIAVGLADGAGFVGPGVPDVGGKVVDVVGLFLPDPEKLIHRALEVGAAKRENGELPLQIIAVDKTELLDGMGGCAVGPVGADGKVIVAHTVLQNIKAVGAKDLISVTHGGLLISSRSRQREWQQAPAQGWGRRWGNPDDKYRTRGEARCSRE